MPGSPNGRLRAVTPAEVVADRAALADPVDTEELVPADRVALAGRAATAVDRDREDTEAVVARPALAEAVVRPAQAEAVVRQALVEAVVQQAVAEAVDRAASEAQAVRLERAVMAVAEGSVATALYIIQRRIPRHILIRHHTQLLIQFPIQCHIPLLIQRHIQCLILFHIQFPILRLIQFPIRHHYHHHHHRLGR